MGIWDKDDDDDEYWDDDYYLMQMREAEEDEEDDEDDKMYTSGQKEKDCPECGSPMYWDGYWECSVCDCIIEDDEDD